VLPSHCGSNTRTNEMGLFSHIRSMLTYYPDDLGPRDHIALAKWMIRCLKDNVTQIPYGVRWVCREINSHYTRNKSEDPFLGQDFAMAGCFLLLCVITPAVITTLVSPVTEAALAIREAKGDTGKLSEAKNALKDASKIRRKFTDVAKCVQDASNSFGQTLELKHSHDWRANDYSRVFNELASEVLELSRLVVESVPAGAEVDIDLHE